jgi:uncharacterized protein (TIGR02145 family)
MRKIFTFFVAVFLTASTWAQSPDKLSYQAVIRNSSDALVTNTQIGMQISILQGSASGSAVFVETHATTTNANGLISVEVGAGTVVSGNFANIDWANGPYFIKTETDPTGRTSYTITGTSQLLSVPYALHAKTAEAITGGISETDPVFGAWDKSAGISITESQISDLQNYLTSEVDGSVTNELQALSIRNDTIYLSNGGFVKLPPSAAESDPVFNAWDKDYYDLINQPAIPTVPTKVSEFTNDAGYLTKEVDGSITNELQALSISNDTIYLSDGGFVKLPAAAAETDPVFVASPANEITDSDITNWNNKLDAESQILSISNDTIYLTGASFVKLPAGFSGDYIDLTNQPTIPIVPTNVSSFTNDAGYLTEEVDGSVTNELIESLALNGTALEVTDAGGTKSADLSSLLSGETNCESCDMVLNILLHTTDVAKLIEAGVPILDLYNSGYSIKTLKENGASDQDLVDAGLIGSFVDERDNHEYKWVKIGNQIWMAENLAYLPTVVGPGTSSETTPYYYVHGYNGTSISDAKATSNYTTYGVLYNWQAAMTACPAGWHISSDAEWTELIDFLGGTEVAGGKMKETGTSHWFSPNFGATNESGFSGLPGGYFWPNSFTSIGYYGVFWRTMVNYEGYNLYFESQKTNTLIPNKAAGFSIRCLKD